MNKNIKILEKTINKEYGNVIKFFHINVTNNNSYTYLDIEYEEEYGAQGGSGAQGTLVGFYIYTKDIINFDIYDYKVNIKFKDRKTHQTFNYNMTFNHNKETILNTNKNIKNDGEFIVQIYQCLKGITPSIELKVNNSKKIYANGWVKINEQTKQIDKIWTKINKSLKEI